MRQIEVIQDQDDDDDSLQRNQEGDENCLCSSDEDNYEENSS
jgi:hypothetical protein